MGAFVIVLREGFEATLLVGLILGVLNKTGQREHARSVWIGVAAALVSSIVIGAILFAAVGELEGNAEALYEGTAMLLAAAVVTWMVFWMRKQARTLGGHLRSQVSSAIVAGGGFALASVAFIGVAREGLESALFLFASVGDDGVAATIVGGSLGAVAAVTLGYLFYRGTVRLDLRRFFMVTGVLVIAFAAYLIIGGLHEFGEAGGGGGGGVRGARARASRWRARSSPRSTASVWRRSTCAAIRRSRSRLRRQRQPRQPQ